jgi:DNA-binding NtrC family response regulator
MSSETASVQQSPSAPPSNISFEATPEQLQLYQSKLAERPNRKQIEYLIIEDQAFFRALLSEMIPRPANVHQCENLKDGWSLYLKTVPDIVFLDVELVESKGHALAQKIREFDPDAYIVMVTGSRAMPDVAAAKQNKVNGYIGKPFNKQKIHDSIDQFIASRKQ